MSRFNGVPCAGARPLRQIISEISLLAVFSHTSPPPTGQRESVQYETGSVSHQGVPADVSGEIKDEAALPP